MANYSEYQMNYIKANALYEIASNAHHSDRSNEDKTNAWLEALELRTIAREELIAWAIDKCKALPQYAEYADTIEQIINHPSPTLKNKVVELSLSLRA